MPEVVDGALADDMRVQLGAERCKDMRITFHAARRRMAEGLADEIVRASSTADAIRLVRAAQEEAAQAAQELAERLAQANEEEIATILGPTALPKFRGEYRYRIIVKAAEEELLRQLVLPAAERMKKERNRNVRVGLALNPTNIV